MAFAGRLCSQPSGGWVDGFILQAPVSDREAISAAVPKPILDESLSKADAMIREGLSEEVMPRKMTSEVYGIPTAFTAYRWHSLVSFG